MSDEPDSVEPVDANVTAPLHPSNPGSGYLRLFVNIDHVATLRQARRGHEPDPIDAALLAERCGADGITAHLREDRRHIQDADIRQLAQRITSRLNLECAATTEMIALAEEIRPQEVTLVPERREEVTTEGGLAVRRHVTLLADSITRLKRAGVRSSLFIDPDADDVRCAAELGADAIELHTGTYSHHPDDPATLAALRNATTLGRSLGLAVHAGHGLTVFNVGPVAAIDGIEELNIGHSIVSRAIFLGLAHAVREVRDAMDLARARPS